VTEHYRERVSWLSTTCHGTIYSTEKPKAGSNIPMTKGNED
jgi:hypothetical protein